MKKIKEFIYQHLFKEKQDILKAFTETNKILEEIKNTKWANESKVNSIKIRKLNFDLLNNIYGRESIEKNKIKKLDFPLIYKEEDNSFFPTDIISFDKNKIIVQYNKFILLAPLIAVKVEFKLNDGKYNLTGYKKNSKLSKKDIYDRIKELNLQFRKTKDFYMDCDNFFYSQKIECFVTKYKEYKELMTLFFIYSPPVLREQLLLELKNQKTEIEIQDIKDILDILKKNKTDKKNALIDLNINWIEQGLKGNEDEFKHINVLLERDKLTQLLVEKSPESKHKKLKV